MRLSEKIGYGLGDAACSMLWKLFSVYLMFFYTDICGLDAWVVGLLFLVTRVWDSLLDPFVGLVCDRTRSRWGTFRPWLLWGALPFGLLGVLTFSMPDWSEGGRVAYAAVTYSAMMVVYSLVNVPYASLLGVISSDAQERTTLASFRMAFAAGGSILAVLLIEPLARLFGGEAGHPGGWTTSVAVICALVVALLLATFLSTRERVRPVRSERHSVAVSLRDLMHNRPWLILAAAAICLQLFNAFRESGTVYYFKYCIGEGDSSVVLGGVALTGSALFVAVAGLAALLAAQALISLAVGGVLPLLWAMSADVADYAERCTGRRDTGLIFSSYSMAQKIGWSVGSAATAWILSLAGFEANAVQSEATLSVIGFLQSILPAAAALGAFVFVLRYPLRDGQPVES